MDTSNRMGMFMVVSIGLIGALALLSPPEPPRAPPPPPDTALQHRVDTAFGTHRSLVPYAIDVMANRGTVQLAGSVDDPLERSLAERLAGSIEGVEAVDNRLTVAPEHARRLGPHESMRADTLDDHRLANALRAQLAWNRITSGLPIGVDSWHGHISLYGTVPSVREREAAARIAGRIAGVRSIYNLIAVENESPDPADGLGKTVSDAWISTKVKTALLYASQINGLDLRVRTERGVVALEGMVANRAELDLALEIAANVNGVRKVDAAGVRIGGRA
jgi:osmotically-inducible protein OsmY